MDNFEFKSWLEIARMDLKSVEEYYRALRKYENANGLSIKSKEYYDKMYNFLSTVLKIELLFSFIGVKVHKDLRNNKSKRPKVYAMTHIGRYDLESSIITRGEQASILWGDARRLYKSPEKLLIDLLPPIFIDTDHRDDCHIGLETMIEHLKRNLNVQLYPEGAYNILYNKVVMRIYDGAVMAALEGGADIVPGAIVQYGRKLYLSYGEEIPFESLNKDNIKECSNYLRDQMATLKWELIEEYSGKKQYIGDSIYTTTRKQLRSNEEELFVKSVLKKAEKGYDESEINRTRYIDRVNPEPEEVEREMQQFIDLNPSFFKASPERFSNYIDVCNNMEEILKNLEEFRSKEAGKDIIPVTTRLEEYKTLKKSFIDNCKNFHPYE